MAEYFLDFMQYQAADFYQRLNLVFSLLSLFITALIGFFAYKISNRQANQAHIETIEKIYLFYSEGLREVARVPIEFKGIENIKYFPRSAAHKMSDAMILARLHKEEKIAEFLQNSMNLFAKGAMYSEDPNLYTESTISYFEFLQNIKMNLTEIEFRKGLKVFHDRIEEYKK